MLSLFRVLVRPVWLALFLLATGLVLPRGGSRAVAQEAPDSAGPGPAFAAGSGRLLRGMLTAVSADKLTLKTDAGDIFTVVLTPNTQIRHGRDQIKLASVRVGDSAGAIGELDRPNRTMHALYITVVSAEDAKKARDAMGKTWIAGNVTAIDDLKMTVLRSDKVSQVIQVDEDTSFRRGGPNLQMMLEGSGQTAGSFGGRSPDGAAGSASTTPESITLADVKIGNIVAGPGELKGGIFTPTQLFVSDPGQRRRRPDGNAGPARTPGATEPGHAAEPK